MYEVIVICDRVPDQKMIIYFPTRSPNGGSDLALDAVLRQLPGLPASAVEETMAPHVQKIASRMFRKSKGSEQVRVEKDICFCG